MTHFLNATCPAGAQPASCNALILRGSCAPGDASWMEGTCPESLTCAGNSSRKRWRRAFTSTLAGLLVVGSMSAGVVRNARAQAPVRQRVVVLHSEVGVASWYGHPYHGRRAAGGQIYDMHKLTAAHRTLPFGTHVRIHNLENDAMVEVVINDRGPFIEGRLIDLSLAAARVLKFQHAGLARVRLELLSAPIAVGAVQ
jgi:rare lipoprotein A (peptidoglycan hydrolase)